MPGQRRVGLACLALRGRVVAIELHQVREIVRAEVLVKLPSAPALIEGVMELRGESRLAHETLDEQLVVRDVRQ